jgi:hypothetical protein
MKTKIFIIVFTIAFWSIAPQYAKTKNPEWKQFCEEYMKWVETYPHLYSAGYCDPKHKSNDILVEAVGGL